MKISVIMPVYNDAKNIKHTIKTILKEFGYMKYQYELIVVDDGSTDGTYPEIISTQGIQAYRIQENSGKGVAFRYGVQRATGDKILMIDSDLQISPQELKHFLKSMDLYAADAVIGNKYHQFANLRYTIARRIMSRIYNIMNRFLFGVMLADSQCGFKLFKTDPLKRILSKLHINRFAFDIEIIVAFKENGFRVADAPVIVRANKKTTAANIPTILNVFFDTIKIWIVKKMGYYRLGD